jgi:hypothetical protein
MGAFRSLLKIGSPSKVFDGYGRWTSEGYARGIESSQGRVDDALGGLLEGARPGSLGAAGGALGGGAGGRGVSAFAPAITINIEGVPPEARGAAEDMAQTIKRELASLLEGMAAEWGAA